MFFDALLLVIKMKELFGHVNESFVQFHCSLQLLSEGFQTFRLDAILYFSFSKLYEESETGPGNTYEIENTRFKSSKVLANVSGMI